MRLVPLLLLSFALAACSTTKDDILTDDQEEAQAAATEECLNNPELAKSWGECNIKRTIFQRLPKIRSCYEKEGKKADYHGDLILKIRVRPTGFVRDVKVEEASLKNKMLSSCLVKEISKLQFAKPPKGINPVIFYPFSLDLVRP